ncbi:ATP-binding cassette domain-containing protein [Serinicoccus chungangensis]|uniref:ATP-binding cassette domain-containing protein n=1 Tax=Serinicoccus chungangensis TaxID=767452 RepID=UPI003B84585D
MAAAGAPGGRPGVVARGRRAGRRHVWAAGASRSADDGRQRVAGRERPPRGPAGALPPRRGHRACRGRRGDRAGRPPGRAQRSRGPDRARGARHPARRRAVGVTLGGTDLADLPLDQVRSLVLVSDTPPTSSRARCRTRSTRHRRLRREQAEAALHAAAPRTSTDILPGGWQGVLDERGRGLSGGQRQRLVLTRALASDAPVLVLVEPTSAVDAHTEARIAERLPWHRRGRTTVVITASPLLLHHADEVAFLEDGRVVATGTHDDLVAGHAAYRSTVLRGDAADRESVLEDPGGLTAAAGTTDSSTTDSSTTGTREVTS